MIVTNENRLARVRESMAERGLDALIVSSTTNVRYLTGFTGSNSLLVITRRTAIFVSDIRYADQAQQEVQGCSRIIITKLGLFEEASRRDVLASSERVGFESQQVTYAQYRTLRKFFPHVAFVSTSDIVEDVMLVKDEHEIASIRKAVNISDRVFERVLALIRPGIRELDISAEISYLHRSLGAERDAFESIVASGERSAFPHVRASQRKIRTGDMLTLDFGCVVNGYNSDMTRTIVVGKAGTKIKRMYEAVLEAHEAALGAVQAGMWAKDLDTVARKKIALRGYGKSFNHALGHGIGLQVHERPKVSQLSTERLQAGNVITVEPGVYIPGFGGVRIEDDVVVTANGCVVLNEATKDFTVV